MQTEAGQHKAATRDNPAVTTTSPPPFLYDRILMFPSSGTDLLPPLKTGVANQAPLAEAAISIPKHLLVFLQARCPADVLALNSLFLFFASPAS